LRFVADLDQPDNLLLRMKSLTNGTATRQMTMSHRNRKAISILIVLVMMFAFASTALADSTGGTGQPGQSCGSSTAQQTPGNAANAPGSAFNPNGMAGTVYAGEQPQNSQNPKSVSQYDVARFQVSQHHP
jgi:hypothetical protein